LETLFKVTGLTRNFGGLVAVDDLSFQIEQGEIVSIIGPNGAGKSTVFNLITGFIRPAQGSVRFRGEEIVGDKPFVIAKKGITRTFQSTTVFTQDTVFDNLVIGHRLRTQSGILGAVLRSHGARADERRCLAKAEEILEFIGLIPFRDQIAANIPQEAQKKLSLGVALATEPSLLLLDEPTGGVNLEEDDSLIRIIQRIRDSGVTICLIEHKMKVVMGISNRVVVLNYGKKIAEGAPETVSRDKRVIEAYLGPGYAAA
jgi:branched-chain amino acid transport system ATP-binding protein